MTSLYDNEFQIEIYSETSDKHSHYNILNKQFQKEILMAILNSQSKVR